MTPSKRQDPINTQYFDAIRSADVWSERLFFFVTGMSILVLFVDKAESPIAYQITNKLFCIAAVAMGTIGLVTRFYLSPRAENKRREDFFSKAYDVRLADETTEGYYNNGFHDPLKRAAAQALENSFFSKSIARKMLVRERATFVIYVVVWLVAVFNRSTDISIVVAMSQLILGEQILGRWFRLEWLRYQFEQTYNVLYALFVNEPRKELFEAQALAHITKYETAKSKVGITLSQKIFDENNESLSADWMRISGELGFQK